ncbi:AAA family ATPase [Conexibacter arvalis]|uniref:Nuclease SbcCD subunit C n=1 Tax=Conexibacter arvalis TaxID=912552 RepID=A0A840IJM8_9ACTN|nr:AAA family ATPase [Conexibacter arvalis]MBB4664929.1 exonuclease SbcC [Conexibacter arvalis]
MRLHRLRVTAFQAFAGSEQVDFDALGSAGLFLLHGDTGAGKTTLLDAVCFALYGEVPGARARDARLRSDHAAPDVRTEVELEVTLRGRRFRIVRRPKQERPKVRGEGVTEEGHSCTVQELRDGEWTSIASRPDEARSELAEPLGMTVDQFCQVVLLPQGEFASFLRAGSDERWKLLERLFGTERFAAVERWLVDRAKEARRDLHEQLRDARDVVSRLSQAAEEDPPEGWEDQPERARDWAGGLGMTAQANAVTAQEAATTARAARAAAEAALAAGLELSERRERHAKATAELRQWEASRHVRDEAAEQLRIARRAAPVAPLLAAADARAAEAADADTAATAAWEALDDDARAAATAAAAPDGDAAAAGRRSIAPDADGAASPDGDAGAAGEGAASVAEQPASEADADPSAAAPLAAATPSASPADDAILTLFDLPPLDDGAAGGGSGADAGLGAPAGGTGSTDGPGAPGDGAGDGDRPGAPAAETGAGDAPGAPADGAGADDTPAASEAPAAEPLRAHAAQLRTRAGALGALVAVEERLVADEAALAQLDEQAKAADTRAAAARQAIEEGERERLRLDEMVQSARRAADRIAALSQEATTAKARAKAAAERDRLAAAQAALDDAVRAAVDSEQGAHAAWLELRERRLAGMAAELATGLVPGEPCAVCGATDHPAPAHLDGDHRDAAAPVHATAAGAAVRASDGDHQDAPAPADPTEPEGGASAATAAGRAGERAPAGRLSLAEQERAAQAEHAARAQERATRERAAADNATALAAARAVAGEDAADALRAHAELLAQRIAHARKEAEGLAAAEAALTALAATSASHEQRRREAEQAAAGARATRAERSAALDADRARVAEARGTFPTLVARVEALNAAADDAERAAAALEQAARTAAARDEAVIAAERAARDAGFADAEEARAAVREETALADLERRLRDFDEGIARRTALVHDETLRAAAAADPPDLDALQTAAEQAARQDEESQGRHSVEQRRLSAVGTLAATLDGSLTALAPIAERSRRASELAALADGSSAANRLRMRLSAYVLAARLEEVAQAATARLDRMSNGRYALVHSDDGGRGRRRGGLELRVVDGWTGQERAPSTLSGGETFIASLALALGLADVVAAEAGGSRLETLFIDEGFGSLDERTLDEVLDVLDTLREGGRAVGIVSHVAELRQRVPAKLHVVKSRTGSRVEQSSPAAAS